MEALKPADIVILVGLLSWQSAPGWTMAVLSERLHQPTTGVFRGLKRLQAARLVDEERRVRQAAAVELLVHGVRWVFPVAPGAPARGLPTAHSGPQIGGLLRYDQPLVWPYEEGESFGPTLEPLHEGVPTVAASAPTFHHLMSLVEVFRVGRARERAIAEKMLQQYL